MMMIRSLHHLSRGRRSLASKRYLSGHRIRAENAVRNRTLRKTQEKLTERANYRYRPGTKQRESLSSLWGDDDEEEQENSRSSKQRNRASLRKPSRKRNFKPFFEEVDEYMSRNNTLTSINQKKSTLESIVDSLENTMKEKGSILDTLDSSVSDNASVAEPEHSAYEREAFSQFSVLVDEIMGSDRFRRSGSKNALTDEFLKPISDFLYKPRQFLPYEYKTLDKVAKDGPDRELASSVREEFRVQHDRFLEATDMDEKRVALLNKVVRKVSNLCAKRARATALGVVWEKVKEAGILLDEWSLNTFLYACTTYSTGRIYRRNLGGGAMSSILDFLDPKNLSVRDSEGDNTKANPRGDNNNDDDDEVDVPGEISNLHDVLFEPTDQSLSIRVKVLVAQGDAVAAEKLVAGSGNQDLHSRTFLPIYRLHLENGDVASALSLLKRMREVPSVILEPESYVQLLGAIAEKGHFRENASPIEGIEDLGFQNQSGPALFDELVGAMAEDVLDISSASARRLYSAFEIAYRGTDLAKHLVKLHPLTPLQPLNDRASDNEMVVSRVVVDTDSGLCPRTQSRLRLIKLDQEQRQQLRNSLSELSRRQFEKFKDGWVKTDPIAELDKFAMFLDSREGDPFTVIIDGANVAYYMQNFDKGKFNLHQIKFVVDAVTRMNEKPLVVMPAKYARPKFTIQRGNSYITQYLGKQELDIISELKANGQVFLVPPYCLDDYFWMLASVSDQAKSTSGLSLDVEPGNSEGRWPGTRPMLLTNDQMRDHKLSLLEPRLFRRWYASHITNFAFTGFVGNECVDDEIAFSPVDFFSREIQSNSSPGQNGPVGTAWHFPVSDWEGSERLCVRIPRKET